MTVKSQVQPLGSYGTFSCVDASRHIQTPLSRASAVLARKNPESDAVISGPFVHAIGRPALSAKSTAVLLLICV